MVSEDFIRVGDKFAQLALLRAYGSIIDFRFQFHRGLAMAQGMNLQDFPLNLFGKPPGCNEFALVTSEISNFLVFIIMSNFDMSVQETFSCCPEVTYMAGKV